MITNQDSVKRYVATLMQTGTNAPVATVLENTLGGELVWTRSNVGDYRATLTDAFPSASVVTIFTGNTFGELMIYEAARNNANSIYLKAWWDGALGDDQLLNTPIEIRVYNQYN